MSDLDCRINNAAVIQYQLEDGSMRILALSDYDMRKLKHRVSIHISSRKVLSVQFYYDISTNKDLHVLKKGVVVK